MHSLSPVSSQCCTNMTSFLLWTGQVLLTLFSKRRTRRSIAVQCLEQGHTWREGGKKEPGARPLPFRSQGSLHWSRLTCLVSSLTSLVATDLVPVVGGDQSTWSHRHQIPWEEKSSLFTGSAQSRLRLSNWNPPWFVPSVTRLQLSWLLSPLPHQGTQALHPWIRSDQKSFSHRICPSAPWGVSAAYTSFGSLVVHVGHWAFFGHLLLPSPKLCPRIPFPLLTLHFSYPTSSKPQCAQEIFPSLNSATLICSFHR